ncbi:MAG TPA: MerR family transcriptional regulator [Streptosporangiaceae bacterium]|nr:MerR family transcriptional regulator [Streptosporangiaceae bacterium]
MAVRLGIGDFSRMTHLSVKALRHYHELGLLTPAEIDPASGYRFYEPSQVPVAQVIRRFRDLGMPLEEIGQVLQAPDAGARNQVIVAHMQRMESQLAATQSVVASLRSLLAGPPEPIAVEHRSVGGARALAIREMVSMPDMDAWWDEAFHELNAAVAAAAVPPAGPRAALYPAELFQLDAGEITTYIPVTSEIRPAGRAAMMDIPAAELAVAVHRGAMADLDQTYGALGTYVARRGIGADGPIREHYLVTAFDTDDESRHLTEVGWPVFQTTPTR